MGCFLGSQHTTHPILRVTLWGVFVAPSTALTLYSLSDPIKYFWGLPAQVLTLYPLSDPVGCFCVSQPSTHPVFADVVPLHAGSLEAEAPVPAGGAIGPGEVPCLAHNLSPCLARAPQLGTVLHVGAGLGAHPEGQLTLLVQAVARPRQVFGQRDGLGGLVQQTIPCRNGERKSDRCWGCVEQRGWGESAAAGRGWPKTIPGMPSILAVSHTQMIPSPGDASELCQQPECRCHCWGHLGGLDATEMLPAPRFLLNCFPEAGEEELYSQASFPRKHLQGQPLFLGDGDTGGAEGHRGLTMAAVQEVSDDGSTAG